MDFLNVGIWVLIGSGIMITAVWLFDQLVDFLTSMNLLESTLFLVLVAVVVWTVIL